MWPSNSITTSSRWREYVPWPSSSKRRYWSSWGQLSRGKQGAGGTWSPCGAGEGCVPERGSWERRPTGRRAWRQVETGRNCPGDPVSPWWSRGGTAGRWRRWWGRKARGPAADWSPGSCWGSGWRRAGRRRRCPGAWWSSPPASLDDATWHDGSGTKPGKMTGV